VPQGRSRLATTASIAEYHLGRMDVRLRGEVERYLRSGEHDNHLFLGWPGGHLVVRAEHGSAALLRALAAEVRKRTPHAAMPNALAGLGVEAFARAKLAPMVRGMFPRSEQEAVLALLTRSIIFLTPENVEPVLLGMRWLKTAWDTANLYLTSFGAEPLSVEAPQVVGLSEETACYVSVGYFNAGDRLEDFVVHEAAHVFHNCKRETIGLYCTRRREWLLDIAFAKRETFAYACEAHSRILELGRRRADRRALLSRAEFPSPPEDQVDWDEYVDILHDAVSARNGWKRILARCAPSRRTGNDPAKET
jgi:hypothetical protein